MKEVCFTEGLQCEYNEYANAYQVIGMENHEQEKLYIPSYCKEKEVTEISRFAFQNCKKIQRVVFPENLRYIGEAAFNFCEDLTEITLPFGVETIEKYAFYACKRLERVEMGDAVRQIEDNAFGDCASLRSFVFPVSLLRIGKRAFYHCENLTEIILPPSLKIIEEGAFYRCGKVERISFGKEISSIGKFAFGECKNVKEITYNGTMASWSDIQKAQGWNYGMPVKKIICIDGEVKL